MGGEEGGVEARKKKEAGKGWEAGGESRGQKKREAGGCE